MKTHKNWDLSTDLHEFVELCLWVWGSRSDPGLVWYLEKDPKKIFKTWTTDWKYIYRKSVEQQPEFLDSPPKASDTPSWRRPASALKAPYRCQHSVTQLVPHTLSITHMKLSWSRENWMVSYESTTKAWILAKALIWTTQRLQGERENSLPVSPSV